MNYNEKDLDLFIAMAKLSQPQLMKVMGQYLEKIYGKERVVTANKFIVAGGNTPIVLLAHLDTVFPKQPSAIYFDQKEEVMWSPDGLGADDRAGIFSIYKIVSHGYRPHIVLTTDEECGGIGAKALADMDFNPFKDLKYMIQLDRRHENDAVYYDCDNPEFNKYVESFGFVEAMGSFTDISTLAPAWGCAATNLSIGYLNEHSKEETLNWNWMFATIEKVEAMLADAENAQKFEYIEKQYSYTGYYGGYYGDWWNDGYGSYGTSKISNLGRAVPCTCDRCHKQPHSYGELTDIILPDGDYVSFCDTCVEEEENLYYCTSCGEPYLLTDEVRKDTDYQLLQFCPYCRGDVSEYYRNEG